jgi:tripartite-type tricarboxylate transporter receptor subunit TctC
MKKAQQMINGKILLLFLTMSFAFALPLPAFGADAASFYKGKTLTIIVTVSPGGGFDMYARMMAPYLRKETGANVIVKNIPGGDGYIGIRECFLAKPDGLNIVITGGVKLPLNQLFGDPRAKGMDIGKLNWLARIGAQPVVMLLSKKLPYRTIDDLKAAKQTITSGTASSLSNQHLALAVLAEALGLDAKMIVGFGGSSEQVLAAMRGELSSFLVSAGSAATFAKQPDLFPFATIDLKRSEIFPDLPAISELTRLGPEQVKLFQMLDKFLSLERVMFTTPGIPKERVEFLRSALDRICRDKKFLAVAKEADRPIEYMPGNNVQNLVAEFLNMPDGKVKELKNMLDKHMMKSLRK